MSLNDESPNLNREPASDMAERFGPEWRRRWVLPQTVKRVGYRCAGHLDVEERSQPLCAANDLPA